MVFAGIEIRENYKSHMSFSELDISRVWTVIVTIGGLAGLLAIVLKCRQWVDDRIGYWLSRSEFVTKLSLLVKPDMVFDQHGAVLADRGGAAFVKERGIHITLGSVTGRYHLPTEIRVEFSRHLPTAPLLTSLNPEVVFISTQRGQAFDWIYTLDYSMTTDDERTFVRRYRLEIL